MLITSNNLKAKKLHCITWTIQVVGQCLVMAIAFILLCLRDVCLTYKVVYKPMHHHICIWSEYFLTIYISCEIGDKEPIIVHKVHAVKSPALLWFCLVSLRIFKFIQFFEFSRWELKRDQKLLQLFQFKRQTPVLIERTEIVDCPKMHACSHVWILSLFLLWCKICWPESVWKNRLLNFDILNIEKVDDSIILMICCLNNSNNLDDWKSKYSNNVDDWNSD